MKFLSAIAVMLLPAFAQAADITGVPKIREWRPYPDRQHPHPARRHRCTLGRSALPQHQRRALDLRRRRARRTDQARRQTRPGSVAAVRSSTVAAVWWRDARSTGRGHQKWLVQNGWALSAVRFSHDYDADEQAARDAKAGLWQGAFIAPWDWRFRQQEDRDSRVHQTARERQRDPAGVSVGIGRTLARLHHQGQRQPVRRMHLSSAHQPLVCEDQDANQQGHPRFCSVDEAEAAAAAKPSDSSLAMC